MNSKKNQRGGVRKGAGRKKDSGLYAEATKVVRIPISRISEVKNFLLNTKKTNFSIIDFIQPSIQKPIPITLFSHKVPAGFPSPADDHAESRLDLNEYLINQAESTFFVRIKGDSMVDAGILDNDIVIVDRSKSAAINDIVLASIDGEFTVKVLTKNNKGPYLMPANKEFKPIYIEEGSQFEIWGVVTGSVRKFK
ncbi:translesion error-prone DNA polymerase V autoproteolytic subunit [Methylophilaceae bacterium]|jgi:DNA polymerase V|nr:translesion error-prone DNA polymerase V autoproteolytic subunit [Methylophilaceae bacterium]MDA9913464.1 translesion error-prone DNA polymerase V autoproteolytic subunit [Methylophilaceae bacterium]